MTMVKICSDCSGKAVSSLVTNYMRSGNDLAYFYSKYSVVDIRRYFLQTLTVEAVI